MYKPARRLFLVALVVSLLASSAYCQCRGGGGRRGISVKRAVSVNPIGDFGRQPSPSCQTGTCTVDNPYPLPVLPPDSNFDRGIDLGADDGNYTVYVVHPLTGREIEVDSFTNRAQAEQLRNRLEKRYWVVYVKNEVDAIREASSEREIDSVIAQIRANGYTVKATDKVVARIKSDDEFSLTKIIESDSKPTVTIEPVTEPTEPAIEADTDIESLVGAWKAVARSADGELRTIEIKLDSGGWAQLSLPNPNGGNTTVARRAVVEDRQLKLKDGDLETVLGELTTIRANEFVVGRGGGQITFVRQ